MNKVEQARSWLLSRVGNPYLMGGTGQPCTVAYRKARAAQYPGSAAKITDNCPRMSGRETSCKGCRYYDESTGTGKRAYDCAQLTRWCMDAIGIKLVSGATSQWTKTEWDERGEIKDMPKDKLCLVFRRDSASVMGHVGVYLGDGTNEGPEAALDAGGLYGRAGATSGAGAEGGRADKGDGTVVHAKGHDYGVVREGLAVYGRFTHYGIPKGLFEETAPDNRTMNRKNGEIPEEILLLSLGQRVENAEKQLLSILQDLRKGGFYPGE